MSDDRMTRLGRWAESSDDPATSRKFVKLVRLGLMDFCFDPAPDPAPDDEPKFWLTERGQAVARQGHDAGGEG